LFRIGRLYTRHAKKALDRDFPSAALGVIYPHGLYDLKRNLGHAAHLSSKTGNGGCARDEGRDEEDGRLFETEAGFVTGSVVRATNLINFRLHNEFALDVVVVSLIRYLT
jgi:hypothetical protein